MRAAAKRGPGFSITGLRRFLNSKVVSRFPGRKLEPRRRLLELPEFHALQLRQRRCYPVWIVSPLVSMKKEHTARALAIPAELIEQRIFFIRGHKGHARFRPRVALR